MWYYFPLSYFISFLRFLVPVFPTKDTFDSFLSLGLILRIREGGTHLSFDNGPHHLHLNSTIQITKFYSILYYIHFIINQRMLASKQLRENIVHLLASTVIGPLLSRWKQMFFGYLEEKTPLHW